MLQRLRSILEHRLQLDKPQVDLNEKLIEWHDSVKEFD